MTKLSKLLISSLLLTGAPCIYGSEADDSRYMQADPKSGQFTLEIPLYGNSYVSGIPDGARVERDGITGWKNSQTVISVYFKVENTGNLDLALYGATDGESRLKAEICGSELVREVRNRENDTIVLGQVHVSEPGYLRLDLKGLTRGGSDFGTYTHLVIGGPAAQGNMTFVPGYTENWGYWGRRGPSVHMRYELPPEDVSYFYNEVTVPTGSDVVGSYFMSNGFGQGYMGIQVNSPTERRILFSVWSPYETDNPSDIPEEDRVVLLRKGEGVTVKDFGNEGSGGQSYLIYPWEAGHTYRFLTEIVPDGIGNTAYTAYFCGHDGQWRLIASFRRPKTSTHYTGAHSFLENFSPSQGDKEREVYFGNQWTRTVSGEWIELVNGTFTCDDTGRKGYRTDYDGGMKNGMFFLRNCGFFDETMRYGTKFTRPATGKVPDIDIESLRQLR